MRACVYGWTPPLTGTTLGSELDAACDGGPAGAGPYSRTMAGPRRPSNSGAATTRTRRADTAACTKHGAGDADRCKPDAAATRGKQALAPPSEGGCWMRARRAPCNTMHRLRPAFLLLACARVRATSDYVPPWIKHQQEVAASGPITASADRYDPHTKTQLVGWRAPTVAGPPGPPPPPESASAASRTAEGTAPTAAANPPPPPSCSDWCSQYTVRAGPQEQHKRLYSRR